MSVILKVLFEIGIFEKYSISFKFKEDENFNHSNIRSILKIKI